MALHVKLPTCQPNPRKNLSRGGQVFVLLNHPRYQTVGVSLVKLWLTFFTRTIQVRHVVSRKVVVDISLGSCQLLRLLILHSDVELLVGGTRFGVCYCRYQSLFSTDALDYFSRFDSRIDERQYMLGG